MRATTSFMTGGLLQSLGVTPILGRRITPEDDDPKSNAVVNISYGLWQRVFGGRRDIVGKEVQLNGQKAAIIGVMPKGFAFPPGEVDPPEVWTALQLDSAKPGGRGSHYLYLLGRLKPNVSAQQAQAEFEALVRHWGEIAPAKGHSFRPDRHTLVSYPFQSEVVSNVRPALLMLLGAVCFVLLIACVNVANLLLARAESRQREIAVRTAIGASSWRLLRQFIAEGILLSLAGAVLGLVLAYGGLYTIKLTNAGSLPRATEIGIDSTVLLVTLVVSIITGMIFGLAPLLHLAVKNVHGLLKDAAGATSGSASAQNFRRGLVAFEIFGAMVLLISCGLMVRAFWKLQEVDIGVNPHGVATMRVTLPSAVYADHQKIESLWSRLQERVTRLPGVQSAALVSGLPPQRRVAANDTDIEGFVPKPNGPIQNVDFYQTVSSGYFETMGIRLIEGRFFNTSDARGALDVAIVNQTMARTFWGNESPVGRRIRPGSSGPWCTVIGVVADVKNAGIDKPTGTEIYLPYTQQHGGGNPGMYVVLRGKNDALDLASAVHRELSDLDSSVPLSAVRNMEDVLATAQSRPRFLTLLLTIFFQCRARACPGGNLWRALLSGGAQKQGIWFAHGAGRTPATRARPGAETRRLAGICRSGLRTVDCGSIHAGHGKHAVRHTRDRPRNFYRDAPGAGGCGDAGQLCSGTARDQSGSHGGSAVRIISQAESQPDICRVKAGYSLRVLPISAMISWPSILLPS